MPKFEFGLVADAATIDHASGKLGVLGEFSYLYAAKLPIAPQFAVFARWSADKAEVANKDNKLEISISGPDGEPVLPKVQMGPKMNWGPHGAAEPNLYRANAVFNIGGLALKAYGGHVVQFFVNGERLGEVRFYVAPPMKA